MNRCRIACGQGVYVKGIVLAGGTGSRLFPLTKITNKHMLPIYDKPMIFYPIQTLVEAGIRDILLVTGGRNSGDFLRLLANGKEFGLAHLNYTYQEGEGGIADALALAEHFADGEKICVILGDNIIQGSIKDAVKAFDKPARILVISVKTIACGRPRFTIGVFLSWLLKAFSSSKTAAKATMRSAQAPGHRVRSRLPLPSVRLCLPIVTYPG